MRVSDDGTNPYRRCLCMDQRNDDGTCNYCEWNEQQAEKEQKERDCDADPE